jgi:hypothetical protein
MFHTIRQPHRTLALDSTQCAYPLGYKKTSRQAFSYQLVFLFKPFHDILPVFLH